MPNPIHITIGQRFGRLTVLKSVGKNTQGHFLWLCRCDCGNEKIVRGGDFSRRRSCGCIRLEKFRAQITIHGQSETPTWQTWRGMIERCYNPNAASYQWYGARGIGICDRWMIFVNFLTDMGERPKGMTIDRIDNDGDYEKNNCRWATPKQQTRNRRRSSRSKYASL